MDYILRGYEVNEATWFYLSLLLIIAVFFRFSRVWSLRNLDLALLLSLSPGLLLMHHQPAMGYGWLFGVTGLVLLRLFGDVLFQRRPRMEQNLNAPGLAFLCICTFGFLMTKVVTEPPPASTVDMVRRADHLLHRHDAADSRPKLQSGPASSLLAAPVVPLSNAVAAGNRTRKHSPQSIEALAARILAILAHLGVVVALVVVGRNHFGDLQIGLAMATLYLLLPCTAYEVGHVNHVLPAALVLWAVVAYRRPMVAGGLLGLACGTLFFPIFLLPLWAAFYGRRGALRFASALGLTGALLVGSLVLTSADAHSLTRQVIGTIDWSVLEFYGGSAGGFWSMHDSAYRIPVFAAFAVILVVLSLWPREKNLEHLIGHSAAIIVATQFWYPHQGGVYLLWYLPMLLLVVFRPRLVGHLPPQLEGSTVQIHKSPRLAHWMGRRRTLQQREAHLFR